MSTDRTLFSATGAQRSVFVFTHVGVLLLLCSCSVASYSLRPYGLWPTRPVCSWDFPGKNTGVGCHFLLQAIFLTQGSNICLLYHRQALYHLSQQEARVCVCVCVCIYMDGYIDIQSIGREELDMMEVTEHNTALRLQCLIQYLEEWALIKCFWNARMNK